MKASALLFQKLAANRLDDPEEFPISFAMGLMIRYFPTATPLGRSPIL